VGDIAGVPYQTVPDLRGVWQIAKVDNNHALILADSNGKLSFVAGNATSFSAQPSGSLDLKTIVLPFRKYGVRHLVALFLGVPEITQRGV
jgi:hypothetical protein